MVASHKDRVESLKWFERLRDVEDQSQSLVPESFKWNGTARKSQRESKPDGDVDDPSLSRKEKHAEI